ncbi:SidC homolog (plasmid) [Legionella adelaidensis]|uniref:SidC homolog n=1 Tax=Legionella adelaidensis TaxID=45056 RepID=A0A0W0R3P1_9GAMM|nr:hypothetical protein [Legionella adelaidensis]KTC65657.1 hypothetical protein Lade_0315 [Legionella adelaidensis]VEH85147.1 SidC homolog [Legionella adelaidensis]
MSTPDNEFLYQAAVEWIKKNPDTTGLSSKDKDAFLSFKTLSPEDKGELLLTLLKTTGLAEKIKPALPYLTFDLQGIPQELYLEIAAQLENESHRSHLVSVSKNMHSFIQTSRLQDKFLQHVAYGEQGKAEKLFTEVYQGKTEKIQEALRHQGTFTDYSGRTFQCSAYEYAYWAKDTHMCRMLERHMDDATKKEMLARVNKIEHTGLSYTQDGVDYCTHHFDMTPLIQALQFYVDNYNAWSTAHNQDALKAAWMNVGLAQRDVPAHVAQEYCRPDRSFHPCPLFNEPVLPRILTFYNWLTKRDKPWFPLISNSGLGFDFALMRWGKREGPEPCGPWVNGIGAAHDLAAVSRLDAVRTADLTLSWKHLNSPAISHGVSILNFSV